MSDPIARRAAATVRAAAALSKLLHRSVTAKTLLPTLMRAFGPNALHYGEALVEPGSPPGWWCVWTRISGEEYVTSDFTAALAWVIDTFHFEARAVTRCDWKLTDPEPLPSQRRARPDVRFYDDSRKGRPFEILIMPLHLAPADLKGRRRIENEFAGLTTAPSDEQRWVKRLQGCGFSQVKVRVLPGESSPGHAVIHTPATLAQSLKSALAADGYPIKLAQAQALTANFFGCNTWNEFVAARDRDGRHQPGLMWGPRPRFSDALWEACDDARAARENGERSGLVVSFEETLNGTITRLTYHDLDGEPMGEGMGSVEVVYSHAGWRIAQEILAAGDPREALLAHFAARATRQRPLRGASRVQDQLTVGDGVFELAFTKEKMLALFAYRRGARRVADGEILGLGTLALVQRAGQWRLEGEYAHNGAQVALLLTDLRESEVPVLQEFLRPYLSAPPGKKNALLELLEGD